MHPFPDPREPSGTLHRTPHYTIRRQLVDFALWHHCLPEHSVPWAIGIKEIKDAALDSRPTALTQQKERHDTLQHWRDFKTAMNQLADAITASFEHSTQGIAPEYHRQPIALAWKKVMRELRYFHAHERAALTDSLTSPALADRHFPDLMGLIQTSLPNVSDRTMGEVVRDFVAEERVHASDASGALAPEQATTQRAIARMIAQQPFVRDVLARVDAMQTDAAPYGRTADDIYYMGWRIRHAINAVATRALQTPLVIFDPQQFYAMDAAAQERLEHQSDALVTAWSSLEDALVHFGAAFPQEYQHNHETFADDFSPVAEGILRIVQLPQPDPAPPALPAPQPTIAAPAAYAQLVAQRDYTSMLEPAPVTAASLRAMLMQKPTLRMDMVNAACKAVQEFQGVNGEPWFEATLQAVLAQRTKPAGPLSSVTASQNAKRVLRLKSGLTDALERVVEQAIDHFNPLAMEDETRAAFEHFKVIYRQIPQFCPSQKQALASDALLETLELNLPSLVHDAVARIASIQAFVANQRGQRDR